MSGAKMLLECLAREGVDCFFGYPGGVTLPFYDALYDHHIRHVLVRHEENAAFAAEGYARATGKVGVCCATSGPGATNLITGLVDAMMDSIPIVAITGQVSSKLIGSDAFQEADTFGITRPCTKHNYLVKKHRRAAADRPRSFLYRRQRPSRPRARRYPQGCLPGAGPLPAGHLHPSARLQSFHRRPHRPDPPRRADDPGSRSGPSSMPAAASSPPDASAELREFVELIDAPAVSTLMGLGALPSEHPNFISMPGMHGSYAANMGMTNADLLIALGVRFDDRVTGRLAAFAPHAKVIHVDIDPAEIGKNRAPDMPIVGDVKRVLGKLNQAALRKTPAAPAKTQRPPRRAWWQQIRAWKEEHPLHAVTSDTEIKPQHLMAEIDRLSRGQAIVTSDVGQHQMWAAQLIRFNEPRLWINSGGLGSMGFGLPAAIGAQFARPDKLVFAIVGDGGFQMSIPELATIASHGLPIKIIVHEQRLSRHGAPVAGAVLQQPPQLGRRSIASPTPKSSPRPMASRAAPSTSPGNSPPRSKKPFASPAVPAEREGDARSKTSIPWCRPAAPSTKWCSARRNRWPCREVRSLTCCKSSLLLLENKPGALMRVTGLLTQRGYNIESLTVARTLDPELSRMTIVVDVDASSAPAGHQADEQADQCAAGHRPHRIAGGGPRMVLLRIRTRRKAAPPC